MASLDSELWERWTGDEIHEAHSCDANPFEEVGIFLLTSSAEKARTWCLAHLPIALEDDVAQGLAPDAGEPLSATSFGITFCPFCGARLRP